MKPEIVVYCCANSTAVPENTEELIPEDLAALKISRLPCSGRADVLYILRAIEEGASMALVVGCQEGRCQFLEGNLRAGMRVRYANRLLAEAGLGSERVRMVHLDAGDDQAFATALRDTVAKAGQLGPWLTSMPS